MLTELDVVAFLKSHDSLAETAQRVFGALNTPMVAGDAEEWGGEHYRGTGLGFDGVVYRNSGSMLDPEFEAYPYALEVTSRFWCVELDTLDLEGPLSEFYARELAFDLDMETATEILLETTEEMDIVEIRSYRRNPQFRLDQSPTTPKVFVVETRQVQEPFDDEMEYEEEGEEAETEDLA